jgi:hypothetical protein
MSGRPSCTISLFIPGGYTGPETGPSTSGRDSPSAEKGFWHGMEFALMNTALLGAGLFAFWVARNRKRALEQARGGYRACNSLSSVYRHAYCSFHLVLVAVVKHGRSFVLVQTGPSSSYRAIDMECLVEGKQFRQVITPSTFVYVMHGPVCYAVPSCQSNS